MAKLSDVFLHLLGEAVKGVYDMTPPGLMAKNAKQTDIENSQLQQERDTQRLTALGNLSKEYDVHINQSQPKSLGDLPGLEGVTPDQTASSGFSVPGMGQVFMNRRQVETPVLNSDASGNLTQTGSVLAPKGVKPIIGKAPASSKPSDLSAKDLDREWANFEQDINPGTFKNKTMSQNLAKKQSAEAVLTLLKQANGDPNILQSPEIAQSVAMLLQSNQGRVAQEQLDKLTPRSLKGDVMKQISYFSNQPAGLGQQAFFDSLGQTAQREGTLRSQQINEEQLSRLPRHEHLSNIDSQRYSRILAAHGVDLSQRGSNGAPKGQGLLGQNTQPQNPASSPALGQMVNFRDSQGGLHAIPAVNLDKAKERDPGLRVIQ